MCQFATFKANKIPNLQQMASNHEFLINTLRLILYTSIQIDVAVRADVETGGEWWRVKAFSIHDQEQNGFLMQFHYSGMNENETQYSAKVHDK